MFYFKTLSKVLGVAERESAILKLLIHSHPHLFVSTIVNTFQ